MLVRWRFTWLFCYINVPDKAKMSTILFLPLLLLLQLEVMIIPVTSRLNSVTLMSYIKGRKVLKGEVMCALDTAFETISSSSLQQCSLKCGLDAACTGFNIKNALTCDVYKHKPTIILPVTGCNFYQVDAISNCLALPNIAYWHCDSFTLWNDTCLYCALSGNKQWRI